MTWPTSLAMAANTSADAAPAATRVATRRSDACCAPSAASCSRSTSSAAQAILDVGEDHHRAAALLHLDRDRHVGDREHRAVAADEPVELARDRLAGRERPQQRALVGGKRGPVPVPVVDRRVAVAPAQLVRALVAERGDRGRVGEPDHALVIHDPDRLLGRLEHRGEELLGSDPQAGKIDQGLGHPALWRSLRRRPQPAGTTSGTVSSVYLRSRGGLYSSMFSSVHMRLLTTSFLAGSSSLVLPDQPGERLDQRPAGGHRVRIDRPREATLPDRRDRRRRRRSRRRRSRRRPSRRRPSRRPR